MPALFRLPNAFHLNVAVLERLESESACDRNVLDSIENDVRDLYRCSSLDR